jgi:transmembrane sensor
VRRLNRYSSVQIEISDPALASMQVSGVFETGDVQAFIDAVQSYLPVSADTSRSGTIRLRLHPN